jgi:site-specific DNA-cytosine methylase
VNVLSCFDGMSCGQLALHRAGIKVNNYFASEVDKHAIKVTQANFPSTRQLGDIQKVTGAQTGQIDLLIGGSPCQGFSFAGKNLNFDDPRSKLFFEFVRLKEELKPKYFLLENVRMNKESQDIISEYMGCQPVLINSGLVSAQNRQRMYWTNIPFTMPEDKQIVLSDILLNEVDTKYFAGEKLQENYTGGDQLNPNYKSQANTIHCSKGKFGTLCAGTHGYSNGYVSNPIQSKGKGFRQVTPLECERLQTVPEGYTNHVSDTQRYKMLGNGWTVDVISSIFEGLNNQQGQTA